MPGSAMTPPSDAGLRLSVWQPATFSRDYIATETGTRLLSSDYQEEIYTWDTGSHDVLGATPTEVSERIGRAFAPYFDAASAPSKRSVFGFRRTVLDLLDFLSRRAAPAESDAASARNTDWSESQDPVVTGDGERSLRVNTALGILRHCLWVAEVFSSVPGASILLR